VESLYFQILLGQILKSLHLRLKHLVGSNYSRHCNILNQETMTWAGAIREELADLNLRISMRFIN
jgi:hypothetical protein